MYCATETDSRGGWQEINIMCYFVPLRSVTSYQAPLWQSRQHVASAGWHDDSWWHHIEMPRGCHSLQVVGSGVGTGPQKDHSSLPATGKDWQFLLPWKMHRSTQEGMLPCRGEMASLTLKGAHGGNWPHWEISLLEEEIRSVTEHFLKQAWLTAVLQLPRLVTDILKVELLGILCIALHF